MGEVLVESDFNVFFSGSFSLFISFLCETTQTVALTSLDKYINKY